MAPQTKKVAYRVPACKDKGLSALVRTALWVGMVVVTGFHVAAADTDLALPPDMATYGDGRLPIQQLFAAYLGLVEKGWQLDLITVSKPAGTAVGLPIIALRSPHPGPAVWILSGIHGEEPAGPNAVAAAIDDLAALGERMPVVVIPLCNPQGYVRNWRYLNMPTYSPTEEGQSVGDSSHLLPDPEHPDQPRAAAASSPEADALTGYLLRLAVTYPPRFSIDLHEDNLLAAGYVYSQGEFGVDDDLAIEAVAVLQETGIPIQTGGQTRFGEEIAGGIIGPVTDSSIDELIEAETILVVGRPQPGPGAQTVLVFETPAKDLGLAQRRAAHLELLRRLAAIMAPGEGETR